MRAGIPTYYGGTIFRSRLEARWAAFFDLLGWRWTYEPFDGHGYIPDFAIHGERPLVIEVKPAVTVTEFDDPVDKIMAGLAGVWDHDVLVVGADPLPNFINGWGSSSGSEHPAVGMLGEFSDYPDAWEGWCFEFGNWCLCRKCDQPAVFHNCMSYRCRPCGHYNGDHYLGQADDSGIRLLWNDAGNRVQWKGERV